MNTVNHFIENHDFYATLIVGAVGFLVLLFLIFWAYYTKEDELRSGDEVFYDPGDGSRPLQTVVMSVFPAFGKAEIKFFGITITVDQNRLKRIPTKPAP